MTDVIMSGAPIPGSGRRAQRKKLARLMGLPEGQRKSKRRQTLDALPPAPIQFPNVRSRLPKHDGKYPALGRAGVRPLEAPLARTTVQPAYRTPRRRIPAHERPSAVIVTRSVPS